MSLLGSFKRTDIFLYLPVVSVFLLLLCNPTAMGVSLRLKKYKSGTQTYYLDIWHNQKRQFEFLDIKVTPGMSGSDRKEQKILAENIRAKRQLELESYQHGFIPKHRRKASFNDYYVNFLEGYKKRDVRMFKYAYEKFAEYTQFRRLAANEITLKLIEGYKEFLIEEAGLSGETPQNYLARFKRVLKAAFNDGLIDPQLYSKLDQITIRRRNNQLKKQVLTVEELRALNATECANPEVKRAFLFSCFTGLGEAEIRKLTWSRILRENKIILFREKSGEQIINDLSSTALTLLGSRGNQEDLIFHLPSDVATWKNLKSWTKTAGIEKHISFYCGRHTFAIQLLRNGANLKTIADLMGHASTEHTVKYLNYLDEMKTSAIMNLPTL